MRAYSATKVTGVTILVPRNLFAARFFAELETQKHVTASIRAGVGIRDFLLATLWFWQVHPQSYFILLVLRHVGYSLLALWGLQGT